LRLAVAGGGWAGLAAAVRAVQAGHAVTVYEMAHQLGGRARGVEVHGLPLDNGQHILIGAYGRTLDLMRGVGCDLDAVLCRRPMELRYPDGRGLCIPDGPAWLGFTRGVLGCQGWTHGERLAMLATAATWALRGFRCEPELTVAELCARLPAAVRQLLIDPLCVAALNTPAEHASARVLLRVLRDSLLGGRGSADLLLPRRSLHELLPRPAGTWLAQNGTDLKLGARVRSLRRAGTTWQVDGEDFDAVVLACSSAEAARLALGVNPGWAAQARALAYEPIVTVYLQCPGARLPAPMTALVEGPDAPAQFAFDHGALGASEGVFAFVISGARHWVEAGLPACADAVRRQASTAFRSGTWPQPPTVLGVLAQRRATFRCTPGLRRPPAAVAQGLAAAGDYIDGPYPATLEGAVRSGEQAARIATCR
jgi:squalene-associated FAD-dependent desaturase